MHALILVANMLLGCRRPIVRIHVESKTSGYIEIDHILKSSRFEYVEICRNESLVYVNELAYVISFSERGNCHFASFFPMRSTIIKFSIKYLLFVRVLHSLFDHIVCWVQDDSRMYQRECDFNGSISLSSIILHSSTSSFTLAIESDVFVFWTSRKKKHIFRFAEVNCSFFSLLSVFLHSSIFMLFTLILILANVGE